MTSSIEARLNEKVVQKGLALHISTLGWKLTEYDELLNRPFENVFINEDLIVSVIKLNPEMVEDEKKRQNMSQNGWIHVRDKFSYTRLAHDMENLYNELINNKI
jgi:hypothetical protein